MRWISFAILGFFVAVAQYALLPQVSVEGFAPGVVVVLGLFYALYAPRTEGLLACWILGLLVDLSSMSNVGLNAFGMGLCALMVVWVRGALFKDHWIGQAVLAFVWMLLLEMLNGLASKGSEIGWWEISYVGNAMATGVLAPLVCWILRRFGKLLLLRKIRR